MRTKFSLNKDIYRYGKSKIPKFQKYFRLYQSADNPLIKIVIKMLYKHNTKKNLIEMDINTKIDIGLYFGHPYCITINPKTIIGRNVNIHKGVTIGQENRGIRQGTPIIGNQVWIGVNSSIVGNITIGDNVLIAPNSYVNCDVPNNSIVFGNPCIIKYNEKATEKYINRKV